MDADVRVICPSDYIDTADDDWPDRLHMCQMQHSRSNFYTRQRIKRAHDGLWARGAAVGNTVIGYKRRPTVPATETEPAKGPFYDEIDEEKAAVIREIFKRIAAGERAVEVGEWLDSIKFAKAKWSRQAKWTAGNVNAIIRRTIYRGFETHRKKVAKRKLRTGKSEYVWNDDDKIQTRESPHLRIVSDGLWYRANAVVDSRRIAHRPARGEAHPLFGTARNRRGLLSGGVFVCGICGSVMYSHGKKDGTYRCSGATKGECWNRVYCMRERVFPTVLEAVVSEVLSLDGVRSAVLARARELHETGGSVAAELKRLDKDEKRLVAAIERLAAAVEGGDGTLASLTSRLKDRERDLAFVRSRRQELLEQADRKAPLPTAAKLLEHLEAVKGQLLGDEGRAAVILRQLLAGPIRVIPYMRIDGKRVVPRLEFTLNLVGALPPQVAGPLALAGQGGEGVEPGSPETLKRTLLVNAFAEPDLVRHARLIVARRLEGKTYKEIAKECDLTKYHMENCARITRLMEDAGLPEPYRRLTEKPDHVPQWCSKHWLKAGHRKGGGRRRKAS